MHPSPFVLHLCMCVQAFGPSGSISHAEQCGNVEPSGLRHPAVTDPTAWVWEQARSQLSKE